MRHVLFSTLLLLGVAALPANRASHFTVATLYAATDAQQQDPQPTIQPQPSSQSPSQPSSPQVVVEEHNTTRTWHPSPIWMAIGGLGVAVLVILLVMASRGGGQSTTVLRG